MKKLLLFISLLLSLQWVNAQDTIATGFINNNGSSAVSFEIEATSSIILTGITNAYNSGVVTTDVWIRQGGIGGTAATALTVDAANGWTLYQSGATVGTLTNGVAPITNLTPLSIPAGSTVGIVLTGGMGYSGTGSPLSPTTFTSASAILRAGGATTGYGGLVPTLGNTPRGFVGYVVYELDILGGCTNPFSNAFVDSLDATTAQVNWTPGTGNSNFYLEYGTTGFTPGTGTKISGTYPGTQPPVYLTGLSVNTSYDYYIYETCNSGADSSYNPSPYDFTTTKLCNPAPSNFAVSNIQPTTADLAWTSNGTRFIIEYGPCGYTQGTGMVDTVKNLNTHTLTNLSGNTSYDVYIARDCNQAGNGISDWTSLGCFTTPCSFLSMPYMQDFSTWPVPCWGLNNGTVAVTQGTGLGVGSAQFNFWGNNAPATMAMITGGIDISVDARIRFKWSHIYNTSYPNDAMTVRIREFGTTNWDTLWYKTGTDFNSNDGATNTAPGTFASALINLNSSWTGKIVEIEFFGQSGFGPIAYIDDFEVEAQPACLESSNGVVSNISDVSADLTWTAGGGGKWYIEYGPVGFTQGTGTKDTTTTNALGLIGLTAATTYDVYIQDSCGLGSTSVWYGPITFSTSICQISDQCEYEIIMIDAFGDGWNGGLVGVYQNNILVDQIGATFTTGSIDTARVMLCSNFPVELILEVPGGYSYEMGFEITDPFGVTAMSYPPTNTFPGPVAGFSYGTFVADCTPPPCPDATNITSSNIDGYSADINWSVFGSNHLEFAVEYGLQGFFQGTGISTTDTVTTTSISLSGLTPVTCYDVYIMGLCGTVNGNSNWVGPFTFCTTVSCPTPSSLSAFNITTTTADIEWTTGSANNWNYVYGPTGTTPGTGTILSATNDTVSLTGLSSSTSYDLWVRDSCGLGDVSAWVGPYSFVTACSAFSAPFKESFNTAGSTPICWTNYNPQNNTSANALWRNTSSSWGNYGAQGIVDHTGNGGYSMGVDASTPYLVEPILETPMIDVTSLTTPELTFWMFMNNTNVPGAHNDFQIDLFDGTTWQDSIYGYANDSSDWVLHTIDLSTYTFTGPIQFRFKVFKVGAPVDFYDDLMIDDISVDNMPACASPTALTASNILTNSVDLGWTPASATATTWDIEYGPSGFALGSGTQVNNLTSSTYALTGLNASSNYCFYVRERCANGTQSSNYAGPFCFTTQCGAVMAPFSESFNAPASAPNCWDNYNIQNDPSANGLWRNTSTSWGNYGAQGIVDHTGGTSYAMGVDASTPYALDVILETPPVDVSNINNPELSFWIFMNNTNNAGHNDFQIDVFDGTNWVDSVFGYATNDPNWVNLKVNLSPFVANDPIRVRFNVYKVGSPVDFYDDIMIDDITIDSAYAPCASPSNAMVQNIACNQLEIAWTSPASSTKSGILYGPAGFNPLNSGTAIGNAVSPQVITGLTPGTAYDFYLADSCALGYSLPIMISGTTDNAPLPTLSFTATQTNVNATLAEWTFDASASSNYTSIDWDFGDGSANGTNALELHNYSSNQVYTVTLTLTNACGSIDTTFMADVNGINIEENILSSSFNVFPNPSAGNVNVEFATEGIQHVKVKVLNTLGQTIVFNDLGNVTGKQSLNIDLNGNASGIYLIQIVTNKGTVTKRVTLSKK